MMGMSLGYLAVFLLGDLFGWAMVQDGRSGPLAIWLLLWAIGYPLSLFLHPRRACWTCRGSGRHIGWVFTYAQRPCTTCEGRGWHLRLGSRLMNVDDRGGIAALTRNRGRG